MPSPRLVLRKVFKHFTFYCYNTILTNNLVASKRSAFSCIAFRDQYDCTSIIYMNNKNNNLNK